jgi:mRNA-degrading endonuclease RelE of RelBE toxin-antitoxin system
MYDIEFSDEAIEDLRWFRKREQQIILGGIESQLRYQPTVATRNRKRRRPNKLSDWELRIDMFRVFYDVAQSVRIVSIEAIGIKEGNLLRFRGEERET